MDKKPGDKIKVKYGCYDCKFRKFYTVGEIRAIIEEGRSPKCKCDGFFRILTYQEEVGKSIPFKHN